ncbi:MAG: AAA family ATPase [Planctomycetota bacterium]|nr:AAA family ATPase [Planctomycetota bacterium]
MNKSDNTELKKKVYQVFDPDQPAGEDNAPYVNLDDVRGDENIVTELAETILLSSNDTPTCQILAGHRGSGKTSELLRLKCVLEKQHKLFVVFCRADKHIERNDVDFPDVLMAVIKDLAAQLKDRVGIELKPGYFKELLPRVKKYLGSEVSLENIGLEVGIGKISLAMKSSPTARDEIRKLLEPDTSNLIQAANDVISQARLELSKKDHAGLVIIVDDLDKMVHRRHQTAECSTSQYLFVNREAQMRGFNCHLAYTTPLALAYSSCEQMLVNLYGNDIPVVPMIRIGNKPPDDNRYEEGYRKLRKMIRSRLEEAGTTPEVVFESKEIKNLLIKLSGGQPRELMILVREAIVKNGLPIKNDGVKRAKFSVLRSYERTLLPKHREIIEVVRQTGELPRTADNDETIRQLLDNRAVLQYRNDKEWYNVNPLVPKPFAPDDSDQ